MSSSLGTISSSYDLAGRRVKLMWNDGHYAYYDYDVVGNVTGIHIDSTTGNYLASLDYDNLGRRISKVYGNAASEGYGYDGISRLSSQTLDLAGTSQDLSLSFSYNPASQIIGASRSNDAYAWGGQSNVDRTYTQNGLNQYTLAGTTAFGYDARGNLTGSGSMSYSYSVQNWLLTASAPTATTLDYDPYGRLYRSTTASGGTRFVYEGGQMIAEVQDGTGSVLRRYVPGPGMDEPVVWYEGAALADPRYLLSDERGSVVAVTNASGGAIAINSYDEYGIPGIGNIGRFQYTGQAWIPELGMYHYKARSYSPTLGRFMQTDPVGYSDGPNWYNYAHSDPVNGSDPWGLADDDEKPKRCQDACPQSPDPPPPAPGPDVVVDGHRIPEPKPPAPVLSIGKSGGSDQGAGGAGGAGKAQQNNQQPARPSRTQCSLTALNNNKLSLALDAGAAALTFLAPEASVAASIAGSALGVIGIGNAIANKDATGAGIAYAGKQAAVGGGFVAAGSNAARIVGRLNVGVLAASVLYDSAAVARDYNKCMAGQ